MQTAKRAWIYAGLALADGVGLVRSGSSERQRDTPRADRLVLVGDDLAAGLAPALRVLGGEAGVRVDEHARRGSSVAAWIEEGWLSDVLADRPPVVVAAFLWGVAMPEDRYAVPTGAMRIAQELADRQAARLCWVAPPGAVPDAVREVREHVIGARHTLIGAEGLRIELGPDGAQPTMIGYAGWAGAIYRQLEAGG